MCLCHPQPTLSALGGKGVRCQVSRALVPPGCTNASAITNVRGCSLTSADGADGPRLIQPQHHAFAQIQLVMHSILADIACHEVLADDELADAGVDQHTN